jgi:hypothetical protein
MPVIELFGMSRAGKTTQINLLKDYLEKEGASHIVCGRLPKKFSEVGSLERFHEESIDHILRSYETYLGSQKDYLIIDRGPYDREVMIDYDIHLNRLQPGFKDSMIAKITEGQGFVDKALLMLITPEESVRRWEGQAARGLDNSGMNSGLDPDEGIESLTYLKNSYISFGLRREGVTMVDCIADIDTIHNIILKNLRVQDGK